METRVVRASCGLQRLKSLRAPGKTRRRGRADKCKRQPERKKQAEHRAMPDPEQAVGDIGSGKRCMKYHAGLAQLVLDAGEQARDQDALAQAMPGAVEAASAAGVGARLKPEGAEQQNSYQRISGSVGTRDPEEQERKQHESGHTQYPERKARLQQIEKRFKWTWVRPHGR